MIIQLDSEGKVIAQYTTIAKATEATGVPGTNIRAVINGKRNTAGTFLWEENFEEMETPDDKSEISTEGTSNWSEANGTATFTGAVAAELTTLAEVLERCKVDLTIWEVKRHTLKHWTTAMKKKILVDSATGKAWKEGVPFQGSPITAHEETSVLNTGWTVEFAHRSDYKEKLTEMLVSTVPVLPALRLSPKNNKAKYVVEFAILDHHLGKDGFDPMTMKPLWSIDEAMAEYQNVIKFGLERLDIDNVKEFLLPTGNDLIHTDSYLGTTTSGTKVASDLFWLQLFKYGKEAVSLAVEELSKYAPVKLMFIPGNHDHNGVLALSEVIAERYRNSSDIEVICSGRGREWYNFGKNLLGWHHGDRCDPKKAHTMMIADVPHLLEAGQYRAVHVGHTHRSHKVETKTLNTLTEEFGLIYEICPSLTPTDKWHDQNIFIGNLRRSKIFGYEYDKGLEFEFIYNKK